VSLGRITVLIGGGNLVGVRVAVRVGVSVLVAVLVGLGVAVLVGSGVFDGAVNGVG
jgi:hypothetical protein